MSRFLFICPQMERIRRWRWIRTRLLDTEEGAFSEECRLFHLYGKRPHLDNKIHPAVPAGAPRNFPRCSQRGCKGESD